MCSQQKTEILQRSLQSTQTSLMLLDDTEKMGVATAIELAKQGEQLKRTDEQLDSMDTSLKKSQRSINNIKGIFVGLKNYLFDDKKQTKLLCKVDEKVNNSKSESAGVNINMFTTNSYENHPIDRLQRDTEIAVTVETQAQVYKDPVELQLEANLTSMSNKLTSLTGLGKDLGKKINDQNKLLDLMEEKMENVDIRVSKQQNDIVTLLHK